MNIDINLKSDKKIIAIVQFDNVRIRNAHNDYLYPEQSILEIDMEDGFRIIDMISEKDITDIDYFKVESTNKTRKKVLFKERDD